MSPSHSPSWAPGGTLIDRAAWGCAGWGRTPAGDGGVLAGSGPLTLQPTLGTPSYPRPPLTISGPLAEPHEICDKDNFGTVIWKETPAGEVASVRCPRNATGEGRQVAARGSRPALTEPGRGGEPGLRAWPRGCQAPRLPLPPRGSCWVTGLWQSSGVLASMCGFCVCFPARAPTFKAGAPVSSPCMELGSGPGCGPSPGSGLG